MSEVDLGGHLWAQVTANGWKTQFCPRRLVPLLMEDMVKRGADESVGVKGCEEGFIDQPGMVMTDRTYQRIKLDTFTLVIPTQDFELFFHEIGEKYIVRTFSDGSQYYKIHGWLTAILLTTEQRSLLLKAMEEMLPQVRLAARREDLEFERRLSKVNEGKVKVVSIRPLRSLPSLDGNKEELN